MSDTLKLLYETPYYLFPFVVVLAGLVGSVHCVGMCGGLVVSVCDSKLKLWLYQLGRLLGYLVLGVLAWFFGKHFFHQTQMKWLMWGSAFFISLILILQGVAVIRGRQPHLPGLASFGVFFRKIFGILGFQFKRESSLSSFLVGLFSIFLPCGWLYSVVLVLTSVAQNLFYTLMMMLFFWLGTLPALNFFPQKIRLLVFRAHLKNKTPWMQWVLGLTLMGIGLGTVLMKIFLSHAH